ncbi:uncharacterized protein LOC109002153 isoform X1 [Juglans regia]|uniref:Uncharacterized protein LOC109002153 isoform X1 n=1 Tax=Juglans regia TaxID=51240 RepID=A0A6P9EQF3_JUGRE|nr:uncharacterized protein LOC109002153 isoform X1 [Juglans regia]
MHAIYKREGSFEDAVLELYAWIASGKEDGKYRNCGDSHSLLLPLYQYYNFLTSSEIFPFFRGNSTSNSSHPWFSGTVLSELWKCVVYKCPSKSKALYHILKRGYVSSSVGDSGTAIARGSRIEGAHGQEAAMVGGSTGNGETGNNGGSRSPSGQGGAALIPVYVAGAANNQHQKHHHGSGNRNRNSIGLSTLVVATLASLLSDLYH